MRSDPALVLLSGGLDSAANLAMAAKDGVAALALTIAYGQKAEAAELRAAEALAGHYNVPWRSLDLRWLGNVHGNALTRSEHSLPNLGSENLDNLEKARATAKAVWVANRNGLFLNAAAVFAEAAQISRILVGFNLEEAATFPDNSREYMDAASAALKFSTMNQVRVESYTVDWNKIQILREARKIGMPMGLVWSCYESGATPCGVCESCQRFARAEQEA